jgi:fructosamine-3-kinase
VAIPNASRLSDWLRERLPPLHAAGLPVRRLTPVSGGCIHAAWCLELASGAQLFAKLNSRSALAMLQAEADGLRALAAVVADSREAMPSLPEPLAVGEFDHQALLVLSWLELSGRSGPGGWCDLGAALARLHQQSRSQNAGRGFGFPRDNFIGATPQFNGWRADWGRFFSERRLAPQLALLGHRGVEPEGHSGLLERVVEQLAGHQPEPVLVHGDLWSGNAGLLVQGGGALFDPAVYWADREVDLAMARLFGGFPPAFFDGYDSTWPLPAGSARRVDLYNLYHLLNHANLFDGGWGGGYGRQAEAVIRRLFSPGIPGAVTESW